MKKVVDAPVWVDRLSMLTNATKTPFLSDVEDFLAAMAGLLSSTGGNYERAAPVLELFGHIAEVREFYAALVASGRTRDVQDPGQGFFARSIKERMKAAGVILPPIQLKAHACGLAGALLDYWPGGPTKACWKNPAEWTICFTRFVWRGLTVEKRR